MLKNPLNNESEKQNEDPTVTIDDVADIRFDAVLTEEDLNVFCEVLNAKLPEIKLCIASLIRPKSFLVKQFGKDKDSADQLIKFMEGTEKIKNDLEQLVSLVETAYTRLLCVACTIDANNR